MQAPRFLLISIFLSSTALLSDTYICNLDFFDNDALYDDVLNSTVTAIFYLDNCRAGNKSIYEEEFGPFWVQIYCQNTIEISVKPGRKEIVRGNYAEKRSLEYFHKGAGLRINCQGSDLRTVAVDASLTQQKELNSGFDRPFWSQK